MKTANLLQFCIELSRQHGTAMDATRFRNELQMAFYGQSDANELFQLGITKRFYREKAGNVLFMVQRRKQVTEGEVHDDDLKEFCR